MDYLDFTLPTLAENLALDEALLLEAEAGGRNGCVLRFWEWQSFAIVLGAGGRIADDVFESACIEDGVPIQRRSSGGGTVVIGSGCLLYTLVLPFDLAPELATIPSSYRWIARNLCIALNDVSPHVEQAGISDLAIEGAKFSGNAQQRKRTHLLHHGTLLHSFDLAALDRYLRHPPRQPAYRKGRAHHEFVRNVLADPDDLRRRLRAVWQANVARGDWPAGEVTRLVESKYARRDWTHRR